jgi:tRNA(adenine34) deaminase
MKTPILRDQRFMKHALFLAKKALLQDEIPVGAVLTLDNHIIGEGYNHSIAQCDPSAHAEILTLRQAGQKQQNYRLLNTTLYVTLEPCLMCFGALMHARVKRLVFGALDAKFGSITNYFDKLNLNIFNHKLEWEGGCLANDCSMLLKEFFLTKRKQTNDYTDTKTLI